MDMFGKAHVLSFVTKKASSLAPFLMLHSATAPPTQGSFQRTTLEHGPCLSVGVAVAFVDRVGRRPLLLGGVTGLVLSLLALSGAQGLVKGDVATWVSVVGLLAYTASYQVSYPLP